ncbi:hypothetical protein P154DRAFT_220345 [Amniculicola lignicola CBS 123094]|uniref:Uncharacterized protein n=1 Tax=Amniculicola lignicola CBS 123094 TaxID=1392246 RepID=A0A6A5WY52_9PLEO|nr:hypothetical protein P154DRAFT_220345 [Amniculicola lignicola CBS 123094]
MVRLPQKIRLIPSRFLRCIRGETGAEISVFLFLPIFSFLCVSDFLFGTSSCLWIYLFHSLSLWEGGVLGVYSCGLARWGFGMGWVGLVGLIGVDWGSRRIYLSVA